MKRWVFILSLLLMMVPMPALAENDVNVVINSEDKELNFNGYAGEEEVFIDNLLLTAKGGDVDRFRFTVNELKRADGGGGEIPRTQVKFAGDKTLREGLPKVFPVIIRGVVEEPGTYEGEAEIVPIGQSQFEKEHIELSLKAKANPSLSTVAQEEPWAAAQIWFILALLVAIFLLAILVIGFGERRRAIPEDERTWLDYGNFYIVAWGLAAVIIGFVVILLFVDRFEDITQALGFLTAFFGAVVGLVGTFFGIKTSSDAVAEAHRGRREVGTERSSRQRSG